ncbi:MAG: hypothetical protein MZV65_53690 [Chromatiales bacterium]|nr:hypothetical protein [Chromatiales bacterium]
MLRALASVDAPGLYYVGVVARMVSKVQTDARTFSVDAGGGRARGSGTEDGADGGCGRAGEDRVDACGRERGAA